MSALSTTCVMLRRIAGLCLWRALELQFGKHASHLSEIFWEGVEAFLEGRVIFLTGSLSSQYIQRKADTFSRPVAQMSGCLGNCISFIDEKVLGGTAYPSNILWNLSLFNIDCKWSSYSLWSTISLIIVLGVQVGFGEMRTMEVKWRYWKNSNNCKSTESQDKVPRIPRK